MRFRDGAWDVLRVQIVCSRFESVHSLDHVEGTGALYVLDFHRVAQEFRLLESRDLMRLKLVHRFQRIRRQRALEPELARRAALNILV